MNHILSAIEIYIYICIVLLWRCSSFGHLCSVRKCSLKMSGLHAVTVTAVLLLYYGLLQLGVSCRLKTWTATSGGEVCLVVGIAAQQPALQARAHSVYRTDKTVSSKRSVIITRKLMQCHCHPCYNFVCRKVHPPCITGQKCFDAANDFFLALEINSMYSSVEKIQYSKN